MSRIYIHHGEGCHAYSTVIVQADNIIKAKILVRKELDRMRLHDEPLNLKYVKKEVTILHVDSGDR